MKILFLTMAEIPHLECRYIYTELMKAFITNGHEVHMICPDKELSGPYAHQQYDRYTLTRVRLLKETQVPYLAKALNFLLAGKVFVQAIKRHYIEVPFDLLLYSTPPITLLPVIRYMDRRVRACKYLMLKDIFPQNAVDLGLIKKSGWRGLLYRYFRRQEGRLYRISDFIGCMSEANVRYLLMHNPGIPPEKVGLCVNSIIPITLDREGHASMSGAGARIPQTKRQTVFFYGGNLGKPQGIPFLLQVLEENMNRPDRFFLICGRGTELASLQSFLDERKPENVQLIPGLPKDGFDDVLSRCDVGLLFLDRRFTIPNFPSRMLSYMEYAKPVLAATDRQTDVGETILQGGFGWWCESGDMTAYTALLDAICADPQSIRVKGENARAYLEQHYTAEITYRQIMGVVDRHGR